MHTSARNLVAIALALASATDAANVAWDGNGDADNDGNWSTAVNWSDDGDPASDAVTLPNVDGNGNSGNSTRTITVDAAYSASALTIAQTTADFTNKLLLNANLSLPNGANVAFSGSGPVEIDIGSRTLSAFGGVADRTYGANITWRSSGGTLRDTWNGSATSFTLQGAMYLTTANTTAAFYRANGFVVDATGVLTLSGGGSRPSPATRRSPVPARSPATAPAR